MIKCRADLRRFMDRYLKAWRELPMKTLGPWLFEAPLAHEMGEYGNSYSSQEYYYNPEFELARELQHEPARYRGGKISIEWTSALPFKEALVEGEGKKGIATVAADKA
jgi:hypothetical protein